MADESIFALLTSSRQLASGDAQLFLSSSPTMMDSNAKDEKPTKKESSDGASEQFDSDDESHTRDILYRPATTSVLGFTVYPFRLGWGSLVRSLWPSVQRRDCVDGKQGQGWFARRDIVSGEIIGLAGTFSEQVKKHAHAHTHTQYTHAAFLFLSLS